MSIWTYADKYSWDDLPESLSVKELGQCIYCQYRLKKLGHREIDYGVWARPDKPITAGYSGTLTLLVCDRCGWWTIDKDELYNESSYWWGANSRAWGIVKSFNVASRLVDLQELSDYLMANYEERFSVDPKSFEDFVGWMFQNGGLDVITTPYSGDDGIDGILCVAGESQGECIAYQAKRYGSNIGSEHIRSFDGALDLAGLLEGIFITTSNFTKGAKATAAKYAELKTRYIHLWDGDRLFKELEVIRRPAYTDFNWDDAPFAEHWSNDELSTVTVESGGNQIE